MAYIGTIAIEHLGWVLFASSLLAGALPDALALLQRRGFRGGGFRFRRRRRRGGFLGSLILFFLLGPIVILALIAFLVYGAVSRARRGR